MEQAYNPYNRKQVILMKRISITTYNYKVYIERIDKTIHIKKVKSKQ